VVSSHVGDDGRGLCTTFEGRIIGVKKRKELGQFKRRSAGYSVLHVTSGRGRCKHTPVGAVVLGADRGAHGNQGIQDIVHLDYFIDAVCRQFRGASSVEGGDLGTDETFRASARHGIGT